MESVIFEEFAVKGHLTDLSSYQIQQFKYACEKAFIENPDLTFSEHCVAAKVYLNLIREFPQIDLGGLNPPLE